MQKITKIWSVKNSFWIFSSFSLLVLISCGSNHIKPKVSIIQPIEEPVEPSPEPIIPPSTTPTPPNNPKPSKPPQNPPTSVPNPNPGSGPVETPPKPAEPPKTTPPITELTREQLIAKINPLFKVNFANETEKNLQLAIVNSFFTRLASGEPSNHDTDYQQYKNELKRKVKTSMIKNTLDITDLGNFLDVSQFQTFNDSNYDVFNFSNANQNYPKIQAIYQPHQEFFKEMVYEKTQIVFVAGKYNPKIWENRAMWPSMPYGLAYKLNGVDQEAGSGRDRQWNTRINFETAIFSETNLTLNKLLYLSNQIMISIFQNYQIFLKVPTDPLQETKALTNMYRLMQAFFHGKNAKIIFQQFLGANNRYNVNNFLTQLTAKNFGNYEPGYLDKLIEPTNPEKSYENLLIYLNYLNYERQNAIVHDDFPYDSRNSPRDPAQIGAFSWDNPNSRTRYQNKTSFFEITKNEAGQISDLDFNKYYWAPRS